MVGFRLVAGDFCDLLCEVSAADGRIVLACAGRFRGLCWLARFFHGFDSCGVQHRGRGEFVFQPLALIVLERAYCCQCGDEGYYGRVANHVAGFLVGFAHGVLNPTQTLFLFQSIMKRHRLRGAFVAVGLRLFAVWPLRRVEGRGAEHQGHGLLGGHSGVEPQFHRREPVVHVDVVRHLLEVARREGQASADQLSAREPPAFPVLAVAAQLVAVVQVQKAHRDERRAGLVPVLDGADGDAAEFGGLRGVGQADFKPQLVEVRLARLPLGGGRPGGGLGCRGGFGVAHGVASVVGWRLCRGGAAPGGLWRRGSNCA